MVHTFTCAGQRLALDVGSGALHHLDDLAYRVVSLYETHSLEQMVQALAEYPAQEVEECYQEVEALKEKGELFTPLDDNEQTIDDNGIVKALCLHVAHDCNLRCGYCFASTGGFDGTRCLMPYEVGKKALDFLVAHSGGGSYDRAVENARKLVAHRQDKDYYARGTFTKRNLDFAEDAEALFDAGFEHISIEPVVLEKGHPLAITEEDLPGFEAEYERLMLNVYKRRKEGSPYNFFHFMIDLSGGPCLRKRLSGCGAGREYMAVTPEGDLYPCHQFVGREQYRIGNLDDESLDETVRGRFLDNHVGKKEACRTCWAQYLCAGGCAANAEAYSGSILQPNPQECRLLKKRTECALALMTLA